MRLTSSSTRLGFHDWKRESFKTIAAYEGAAALRLGSLRSRRTTFPTPAGHATLLTFSPGSISAQIWQGRAVPQRAEFRKNQKVVTQIDTRERFCSSLVASSKEPRTVSHSRDRFSDLNPVGQLALRVCAQLKSVGPRVLHHHSAWLYAYHGQISVVRRYMLSLLAPWRGMALACAARSPLWSRSDSSGRRRQTDFRTPRRRAISPRTVFHTVDFDAAAAKKKKEVLDHGKNTRQSLYPPPPPIQLDLTFWPFLICWHNAIIDHLHNYCLG